MHIDEITGLHDTFCQPGFGTTMPDELAYIHRLIAQHRPKRMLEIGTASGLTTGFIARFMAENGGESVTSVDLSTQFFAQKDKPVGYLAREIYPGSDIRIDVHGGRTSLDLDDLHGPWDMAFIDANHQHPWPILDTLAVAPYLTGSRIVIHHDLQLYRRFRSFRGIGPRVLFSEMPHRYRQAVAANGWNIFSVDLKMSEHELEHSAIGALCMPWTAFPPVGRRTQARFEAFLATHYSAHLVSEFKACAAQNRVSLPKRGLMYLRMALQR